MSKYVAFLFIDDKEDEFSEAEIKEQITENMLQYADSAPFSIQGLIVRKGPVNVDNLF